MRACASERRSTAFGGAIVVGAGRGRGRLRHCERLPRNRERRRSASAPALAATLNATIPLPLPVAPDVTVSHEALLVALQAQPAVVDTSIGVPAPPPAPKDWSLGLMS